MGFLTDLNLRKKFYGLAIQLVVALIAAIVLFVLGKNILKQARNARNFMPLLNNSEVLEQRLNDFNFDVSMAYSESNAFIASLKKRAVKLEASFNEFSVKMKSNFTDNSDVREKLAKFSELFNRYFISVNEYLNSLKSANRQTPEIINNLKNVRGAYKLFATGYFEWIVNIMNGLMPQNSTINSLTTSLNISGGVLIIFLIIVILLILIPTKKVFVEPIVELSKVMRNIRLGKISDTLNLTERKDEIGNLNEEVNRMFVRLQEISEFLTGIAERKIKTKISGNNEEDEFAKSLNRIMNNFKDFIETLKNSVGQLSTSGAEINSTIAEISSSISETASSISQTTATVEEVNKTNEVSLNKSKIAVKKAEESEEIAENSVKIIENIIEGFEIIQNQVSREAQNIIQLTAQNISIGEIINWVKDIANQLNLLSVNASIEAAKSGEEGKGFIIVAQEIKELAEQSKKATEKINSILNEIKDSINSSALANEKSQKVIAEQMQIARENTELVNQINKSVKEIRDIIKQNSLTIEEQNIGMKQVVEAMEEIKLAAKQNAEGSRQLKDSSALLRDLSEELQEVVDSWVIEK